MTTTTVIRDQGQDFILVDIRPAGELVWKTHCPVCGQLWHATTNYPEPHKFLVHRCPECQGEAAPRERDG